MGCCLSTDTSSIKDRHLGKSPKSIKCGGAPPYAPPSSLPLEEESVKEVLSETPIPKPHAPIAEKRNELLKGPENQVLKVESTANEVRRKESMAMTVSEPTEDIISEVSEHSELCSLTESFSTTTTATATAQEKRDDGEEVTQRSPLRPSRKRPNLGDKVGSGERNVRSPARRSIPSPEMKKPMASSKPVQGRAMMAQRRNVGLPNGVRRDSGDGSARRSRSPVTRTDVGSRRNVRYKSPGLSETGRPGGRSPARAVENGGGLEKQKLQNDNIIPENSGVEKQNDTVAPDTSDSLENPLVSLECFIFL